MSKLIKKYTLIEVIAILCCVMLILSILGVASLEGISTFDYDAYTATVTKLEIKRNDGDDIYLVFTTLENGQPRVFEITDSWAHWRFNSSDMYAGIIMGHTYKFGTYGWRIPFFSMYENILEVDEVGTGSTQPTEDLSNLTKDELIERLRSKE